MQMMERLSVIERINDELFSIVEGLKKQHKNPEGGLSKKGRDYYKSQGMDLKPPVSKEKAKKSPKSAKRRKSFCARSKGQQKMHNIDCSKTPDKRICKARRKWDC